MTHLKNAVTELLGPLGKDLIVVLQSIIDGKYGLGAAVKGVNEFITAWEHLRETQKVATGADLTDNVSLLALMGPALLSVATGTKNLGTAEAEAAAKGIDFAMSQQSVALAAFGLGKALEDPNARTISLSDALKAAEKDLSEVEKAVRMGVGTDVDAAAARQKVVDVMVKLHPAYVSIFADNKQWNDVLKISSALIAEQSTALAPITPDDLPRIRPYSRPKRFPCKRALVSGHVI